MASKMSATHTRQQKPVPRAKRTQTTGGRARKNSAQKEIAEPKELNDILTAKLGYPEVRESVKTAFVETGIIAERRYVDGKTKRKETDFLVEGLPVWRRYGSTNDVDEDHLDTWKELKEDYNRLVQADVGRYHVTMHGAHPVFEQWTGAKEIFENGLKDATPVPLAREAGGDGERDRIAAMEMLGHMIDRCLKETVEDVNFLSDLMVDVFYGAEPDDTQDTAVSFSEEIMYGRRFLAKNDLGQRQDLAESLLVDGKASEFHCWTLALCIAILPMKDFLELRQKNTATRSSDHAMSSRLRAYRSVITKFLDDYHEQTREKKSFVHTLRTFSSLSEMLRTETYEILEDVKALQEEQDRISDNEAEEEAVAAAPVLNATGEEAIDQESTASNHEGEEDGNEEEPDTKEDEIREIEEAAKRDAALSDSRKRTMNLRKRKNGNGGSASGESPRDKKRKKTGGLTVR